VVKKLVPKFKKDNSLGIFSMQNITQDGGKVSKATKNDQGAKGSTPPPQQRGLFG
jgi:hypothetical protein